VFDFSHLEAASAIVGQCNHLSTSVQINGSPKASINTHARSCNCQVFFEHECRVGVSATLFAIQVLRCSGDMPDTHSLIENDMKKLFGVMADLVFNTIAYTPEQYATDPEALRKAFSHVSDLVVNKLVEHLKQ
jgi:hypothetical protein